MIKINTNNKFIQHFTNLNIYALTFPLTNIYKVNNLFILQFGINTMILMKEAFKK